MQILRNLNIQYPIPKLVENHVKVKKYMVYKYPNYYNNLSEASKQTLEYQGGKMSKEEVKQFENDPVFRDSIKLRQFDDESKNQYRTKKFRLLQKNAFELLGFFTNLCIM